MQLYKETVLAVVVKAFGCLVAVGIISITIGYDPISNAVAVAVSAYGYPIAVGIINKGFHISNAIVIVVTTIQRLTVLALKNLGMQGVLLMLIKNMQAFLLLPFLKVTIKFDGLSFDSDRNFTYSSALEEC